MISFELYVLRAAPSDFFAPADPADLAEYVLIENGAAFYGVSFRPYRKIAARFSAYPQKSNFPRFINLKKPVRP